MNNLFFCATFLFGLSPLQGQSTGDNITKGDILELGAPTGPTYSAIDFPRRNIILKRGAIANFNALIGERVVVAGIDTDKKKLDYCDTKTKERLKFLSVFSKS